MLSAVPACGCTGAGRTNSKRIAAAERARMEKYRAGIHRYFSWALHHKGILNEEINVVDKRLDFRVDC